MALPINQQNSADAMDPNTNGTASQQPLLLVLHDFEARSPDEISLAKGEMVELLIDDAEFGDGWYTVCVLLPFLEASLPSLHSSRFPFASVSCFCLSSCCKYATSCRGEEKGREKLAASHSIQGKGTRFFRRVVRTTQCNFANRVILVIGSLSEKWSNWSLSTG
jgi:hypothetical protein